MTSKTTVIPMLTSSFATSAQTHQQYQMHWSLRYLETSGTRSLHGQSYTRRYSNDHRSRDVSISAHLGPYDLSNSGEDIFGGTNRRIRTCQDANKVLHGHFISPIVHFDVVSVQVKVTSGGRIDTSRELVSRVARCIIGEHKDDIRVRDS